jgi:hypothetical protein
MSTDSPSAYYFLPWVRYGVLKSIEGMPVFGKKGLGDSNIGRVKVPITLQLIGSENGSENTEDVEVPMSIFGPGDVVGIDPREIVRTEPSNLSTDFPPHLFPFIEFDRPDFPWLFTPAAPDAGDCLRPWIVLVVVPKEDGQIIIDTTKPLPVLRCSIKQLPDLEESWAWAHAQYVGDTGETQEGVADELGKWPAQNVSRLLCPRKLTENQGGANGYLACVVPAFQSGRQAGLGETVDDKKLEPAWKLADADKDGGNIDLPVYYHWEFGTGAKEDFEDFINRLTLLENLSGGSSRRMDLSKSGGGMPDYPDVTLGIAAALETPEEMQTPETLPATFTSLSFQLELQKLLNSPEISAEPRLPPPLYGGWCVESATPGRPLLDTLPKEHWLKTLNLDPRYRVAAALGTQVVQREQEQLVAAAWEQAAELKAVNQWFKQKQLGRAVTASIHAQRLGTLSEDTFWQLTAPIPTEVDSPTASIQPTSASLSSEALRKAGAVLAAAPGKAEDSIIKAEDPIMKAAVAVLQGAAPGKAEDSLSKAVVSASYRRMLRPLGRLARQTPTEAVGAVGGSTVSPPPPGRGGLLQRIATGQLRVAPDPGATAVAAAISGYRPAQVPAPPPPATVRGGFPDAALTSGTPQGKLRDRNQLMGELDPYLTFNREVERVEGPQIAQQRSTLPTPISMRDDPLQPIANVPLSFPQPMYVPLRNQFQNMLIADVDRIPNNSLALLQPNAAFIESYMVGLNHELTRGLLWREYPTLLGTTYFHQFWDVRGSVDPKEDIDDISAWTGELGTHLRTEQGRNLFMLLIKGDLLVRYPNIVIYVQRARFSVGNDPTSLKPDKDSPEEFPLLRINPVPGVTLLGFDLDPPPRKVSPDDPNPDPGWFFIIEEHPTETRFGLDNSRPSDQGLTSWRDLIWDDVKTRDSGYLCVMDSKPLPSPPDTNAEWGKNSANMAYITLQKAYRLQVHSSFWFSDKG